MKFQHIVPAHRTALVAPSQDDLGRIEGDFALLLIRGEFDLPIEVLP